MSSSSTYMEEGIKYFNTLNMVQYTLYNVFIDASEVLHANAIYVIPPKNKSDIRSAPSRQNSKQVVLIPADAPWGHFPFGCFVLSIWETLFRNTSCLWLAAIIMPSKWAMSHIKFSKAQYRWPLGYKEWNKKTGHVTWLGGISCAVQLVPVETQAPRSHPQHWICKTQLENESALKDIK